MCKSPVDEIGQQVELFLHCHMSYNLINSLLSLYESIIIIVIGIIKEFTLFVAIENLDILQAL